MKKIYLMIVFLAFVVAGNTQVIISQYYEGASSDK